MRHRTRAEAADAARPRNSANLDGVLGIIWRSALQAFVRAIFIMVFGSIAAGMLGGLWGEMVPSSPPHLTQKAEAEVEVPAVHPRYESHAGSAWATRHRFLIIFLLIFIPTAVLRLSRLLRSGNAAQHPSRAGRIFDALTENWFHLVVGNAFGAAISAAVVGWVSQWTPLGLVLRESLPAFTSLASSLFGTSQSAALHDWFAWYGANQFKFTFWVFYLAAIMDDLGLPNVKTVGRWLGRKVRQRKAQNRMSTAAVVARGTCEQRLTTGQDEPIKPQRP